MIRWIKSTFSNPSGNCVELATLPGKQVGMRNSRHKRGPVLIYTNDELDAFLKGAKAGEFDHLLA